MTLMHRGRLERDELARLAEHLLPEPGSHAAVDLPPRHH